MPGGVAGSAGDHSGCVVSRVYRGFHICVNESCIVYNHLPFWSSNGRIIATLIYK